MTRRHLLLVGLPGAGKSTVGRLAAGALDAAVIDPDELIVRRMQMPVARIFGEFGEARFRELEAEAVTEALAGPAAVVVPGGGWAAQPGAMPAARDRVLTLYLQVSPRVAVSRLSPGDARPMLQAQDPLTRMRELLGNREAFYLLAERVIPNDRGTAEDAAWRVVEAARQFAGW